MKNKVTLEFLGTGTSQGVPMIACDCEVCKSKDPKDKRLRASVFIEYEGLKILVDAGPDFRYQMLRADIRHIDSILFTHNHKDHTAGLDDVRAYNYLEKKATEIYCEDYVQDSLKNEFPYAFCEHKYPGVPEWRIHKIENAPFFLPGKADSEMVDAGKIDDVEIIPIRGLHYKLPVLGFRFGNIAYCTDMNSIAEEEFEKLKGLDHFIISCVRRGHHISHFSLEEAIEVCKKVGAKKSWLTHLSHMLPTYSELIKELPENIAPAYDGLIIKGDF